MKRIRTTIFIISLFLPLVNIKAKTNVPPTSSVIYKTLDELWGKGDFYEIDMYIDKLEERWGDYAPTQLAVAMYQFKCNVDVKKALSILENLDKSLSVDFISTSPVFFELLNSKIYRYKDTVRYYLKRGYTREYLQGKISPRKMVLSKRSKHWGEEMLFFNVPEVFITSDGVKYANVLNEPMQSKTLETFNKKDLSKVVCNDKISIVVRKEISQILIDYYATQGGVTNLVHHFRDGNIVYTYQDTVDALIEYGDDAIPVLIKYLNNYKYSVDSQKMAIWALARMGDASPAVIDVLQSITTNTSSSILSQYAKDAMKYLQNSKLNGQL